MYFWSLDFDLRHVWEIYRHKYAEVLVAVFSIAGVKFLFRSLTFFFSITNIRNLHNGTQSGNDLSFEYQSSIL